MDGLKIPGLAMALPSTILTNQDLCDLTDTSHEWIVSRTGIETRFIAQEESLASLAGQAAAEALERAHLGGKDLDVIIAASLSAESPLPCLAARIAGSLPDIRENVLAFDLNAACSGFLYALQSAFALLQPGQNALVIGCEQLSRYINWQDRKTCVLFGDGAGAAVIQKTPDRGFYYAARGLQPDLQGWLTIPAVEQSGRQLPGWIEMNGPQVFRFALQALKKSVCQVLEQAGHTMKDVDLFICHQANARILSRAARDLQIPEEKMFVDVSRYGNTSAASIAIAMADAWQSGRLQPGMRVILAGFGGGFSYGSIYFQWQ